MFFFLINHKKSLHNLQAILFFCFALPKKGCDPLVLLDQKLLFTILGVRMYITPPPSFSFWQLCALTCTCPPPLPSLYCSYLDWLGPECWDFRFILQPGLLLKGYNNSLSRLWGMNRENISLLNFKYNCQTRGKLEGESISCYCIECQKQVGSVTGNSLKGKM